LSSIHVFCPNVKEHPFVVAILIATQLPSTLCTASAPNAPLDASYPNVRYCTTKAESHLRFCFLFLLQLGDHQMGGNGPRSSCQGGDGQGCGVSCGVTHGQNRIDCRGFHNGHSADLVCAGCAADQLEMAILVAVFATPNAVSGYAMARNYEADHELAGEIITLGTCLSIFTIFVFITLAKTFAWI